MASSPNSFYWSERHGKDQHKINKRNTSIKSTVPSYILTTRPDIPAWYTQSMSKEKQSERKNKIVFTKSSRIFSRRQGAYKQTKKVLVEMAARKHLRMLKAFSSSSSHLLVAVFLAQKWRDVYRII